ncbi:MAG: biotin synthase BioB, partial [Magnetococcales bacterium]|nr:biotin synthase BioB [Magnetococcales bacterium]
MSQRAISGELLSHEEAVRLMTDRQLGLLPLLQAAFVVRHHFFGRGVRLHILNNIQNGYCPEDCNYCAQAAGSGSDIDKYRLKSDDDILEGAERAWRAGAWRYCLVSSGRGPAAERIDHLCQLIGRIKKQWPIQVCLSAGFIDQNVASTLKEAGLDRYNHNLNTADGHYGRICTTHSYADRLKTLQAARSVGLEVCSGLIIGMGESVEDVISVAMTLRELSARSIPVNFYVHVPGAKLGEVGQLTPEYG